MNSSQAGVCDETLRLLRRLRIQYRAQPRVFRDLIWLSAIACSASATELVNEKAHSPDSTLSTQDAAAIAGLKPGTIRRACREQRLAATKTGRDWLIPRAALAEWLARRAA